MALPTKSLREKAEALSKDALDKDIDLAHLTKEDKRVELSQKLGIATSRLNAIHDQVKAKIEDKTRNAIHDLKTEIEGAGITGENLDRHIIAAAIIESGHETEVREAINKQSSTTKSGTILSYIPKEYTEHIPDFMKSLLDVKPSFGTAVVGGIGIIGSFLLGKITLSSAILGGLAIGAGFLGLQALEKLGTLEGLFGGLKNKFVRKESPKEKEDRELQERTLAYRETLGAFFGVSPLSEPVLSSVTTIDYVGHLIKNWSWPSGDGIPHVVRNKPISGERAEAVMQTLLNPEISSKSLEQLRELAGRDLDAGKQTPLRTAVYLLSLKRDLLEKIGGSNYQKVPIMSLFLGMSNNLSDAILTQNFIDITNFGDPSVANIYGDGNDDFLTTRISETPEMLDVYSILKQKNIGTFKKFTGDMSSLNTLIEPIHKNHPHLDIMNLGVNEKGMLKTLYPLLVKTQSNPEIFEKKLSHLIEIIKFGFHAQSIFEVTEIFNITETAGFDLRSILKGAPLQTNEVLKFYFITGGKSDINSLPDANLTQVYLFILSLLKSRNENEKFGIYGSALIKSIFKGVFGNASKIPPSIQSYIRLLVDEKKLVDAGIDNSWEWLAKWAGAARENPLITSGAVITGATIGAIKWRRRVLRRTHVNTTDGTINN